MKNLFVVLLVGFFSLVGSAHARNPVPLVNLENASIATASGKPLTLDDVNKALRQAAISKGWNIADAGPGKAVGTLMVHNKHTVIVDIAYTEKAMSFTYKDSSNMRYGIGHDDKPVIHPFYMNWVRELYEAVKLELTRL